MKQVNEYRVVMAIAIAALLLSFMCASCTPEKEIKPMRIEEAADINTIIQSMRESNGIKSTQSSSNDYYTIDTNNTDNTDDLEDRIKELENKIEELESMIE